MNVIRPSSWLAVLLGASPLSGQGSAAPPPGPSPRDDVMKEMGSLFAKNDHATAIERLGSVPETAPPHIDGARRCRLWNFRECPVLET